MNIFLRHVWKNALVCWSMISLTFKFQRWVSIYYVKIQKQLTLSMCDYISVLVISIFLGVKMIRSSRPKLFLKKDVLKISSKFTGEHPCQSAILIKLQSNLIETTLRHGCSPVNLLHIFRTPFPKNTFMQDSNNWNGIQIPHIFPYSVQMRENTDQKNSE